MRVSRKKGVNVIVYISHTPHPTPQTPHPRPHHPLSEPPTRHTPDLTPQHPDACGEVLVRLPWWWERSSGWDGGVVRAQSFLSAAVCARRWIASTPAVASSTCLIHPLVAMSCGASSAGDPSGATPSLEVDLAELLSEAGNLGASPCEVGEGASPCAGEGPGLSEVKDETRTEESPCKKPRTASPGRIALTPTKREDAKSEHTSPASGGRGQRLVKGQRPKHSDKERFCGGCHRQYGVSPCYVDRTAIVEWGQGGGRGGWCNDCYSLFRTWFLENHDLTYFLEWLDADRKHREEFQEVFLAFISLKAEGEGETKVTKKKLSERLRVLKWVWAHTGSHPAETVVIPLADALSGASPCGHVQVTPSNLTTMWSARGGFHMGVRVRHPFVSGDEGVIARPSAPAGVLMGSAQWVQTTNAADRQWLSQEHDVAAPPSGASPCGTTLAALPPAPQPEPASKIAKRWTGVKIECVKFLQYFGTAAWEKSCSEAAVGKFQLKASGLQSEAAAVGEEPPLYEDLGKYSDGLTNGKHFIRAYRDYVKSNHKVHRLADCYAPLEGLLKLLGHAKVAPASSLTLLWLRACLWEHSREVGSTCKGMQTTLDQGLPQYIADVGEAAAEQVDLWVRVLVHEAFLTHWAASIEKKELLSVIEGDFAQLGELLRGLQDSPALGCLRPVGEDALALSVLLRVMGEEPPEVRALQEASARLKTPRMKAIHKSFNKGCGPEMLTRVAELLQASGNDEAADAKLRHAQERLQGDRVPRLVVTADSPMITSWESIHDMSVVSLLDEIVLEVAEALSSWSPIQREAQAAHVRTLVSSLLEVVSLISEALVYDMTAIVASTAAYEFLEEKKDASSWDQPLARAVFQELEARRSMYMIDDTPFQEFLPRLTAWLQGLPDVVALDVSSCQLCDDIVAKALANGEACAKVDEVLRSVATVLDVERLDAREFVDEFTRHATPALQTVARLPMAAQLRQDLDALEGVSFQLAELDAPVQVSVDFGESSEVIAITSSMPTNLKAHLGCFVLREVIDTLIGEALELILGRIAQSAALHKVRAPRSIPDDMSMAAQLGLFADATADVTKPAQAWLKQRSVSAPWNADSTVMLARQMLQALRDKARVVGVSPFCNQGTAAERSQTDNIEALTAALDVFMVVGKVSCLFAWVRATFFGTRPGQMVVDAMVHADLALAISEIQAQLRTADSLIKRDIDGVLRPVWDLDWRFPVSRFTEWKVLAKMLTDDLARVAVSACVKSMTTSAESLEKVIPPWEFLRDGAKFAMQQADRCLVRWHAKKELNEGGMRLAKSLKTVADHWATWGFPGTVEDDALLSEQMGCITGVFKGAQKAILLGAIVNLLHNEKPSEERNKKARSLIEKMVIGSPHQSWMRSGNSSRAHRPEAPGSWGASLCLPLP